MIVIQLDSFQNGTNMDITQFLEQLKRSEKLHWRILESLRDECYIQTQDVTNMHTPPGERDYLFVDFTAKERQLLEGHITLRISFAFAKRLKKAPTA